METSIDKLSDAELRQVNAAHAWVSGTKDSAGRVLGATDRVMEIPERRVVLAHEALNLSGKTVAEFGCLEGGHTVALCQLAKKVTAVDGRQDNVTKTLVRCGLYDVSPTVKVMDLETKMPGKADVYFHSGVLYHLVDPIAHLEKFAANAKEVFLDTHHAKGPTDLYRSANGREYRCKVMPEPAHPRSGLRPHSRWISLTDILLVLEASYEKVVVLRDEREPMGNRVSIAASERKKW